MAKEHEKFNIASQLGKYGSQVSIAYDDLEISGSAKSFDSYIEQLVGAPEVNGLRRDIQVGRFGDQVKLSVKVPSYFPGDEQRESVIAEIEGQGGQVTYSGIVENLKSEKKNYSLEFLLPVFN